MASRSRKVALGGVLGALCIAFLYLASYLPTSRLFLYGISSVFSSIILIESGHGWSWVFYLSTSLLGFLIIPDKVDIVPYMLFFGFYGIIKYYIEGRIKIRVVQYAVKGLCFAAAAAAGLLLISEFFGAAVYSILPVWAIGILALAVFFIYDYAYTLFISYYENRLRKRIR